MGYRQFFDAIESEALRAVAAHWHAARGPRLIPAFRDIDPVAIGRNLRYVWAWRYDRATETFTGRLAGEEVDKAFGKSLRGKDMAEFYAPDVYQVVFPRHRRVVVERGFMHARGMIFASMGRTLVGERIAMPLAEDGLQGDGIMGGTYYRTAPADARRPGDRVLDPGIHVGPEQAVFFPLGGD